jgi:hypothetical protein
MSEIPVTICIDVEPNERELDLVRREPWTGFAATYEFYSALRSQLQSITSAPVHFTWLLRMDPQVNLCYGSASWTVDQHPNIIEDLQSHGDEMGLHVHATRWDEAAGIWRGDYGDQEWVDNCVSTSFTAYERVFQRTCRTIGLGDRWSNHETVELIERLGGRYFTSSEPGARPSGEELLYQFTGRWPDYSRVPYHPYRPAMKDYQQEDARSGRDIWMIPLSAGKYEGPKSFRFSRLKRLARLFGVDRQRKRESLTLRLQVAPHDFRRNVDGLLRISRTPYLSFVVRSEVCSRLPKRANLEQNIDYLSRHPQARQFRFVTPRELIEMLAR